MTDGLETQKEKAIALFYFVRDNIKYKIFQEDLDINLFRASQTLTRGYGFCIPKAVLLVALARSLGIPSRLHFADIRNHRLPPHIFEKLQTDIMVYHGYAEYFFDNKWFKVNPAFDNDMCLRHNFFPVEFRGEGDALFHHKDRSGRIHIEYIADHGTFDDLPYEVIRTKFRDEYRI